MRTWFLLIFMSLLSLPYPNASLAASDVHIAIAGPMGGTSGPVGLQYKVGVYAALSQLPGSKLLGRTVVTSLYNDNCANNIATAVAEEIVETPPAVVIGHSCSGATLAGAPIYARNNVLQITPASSNPQITEMGIKTLFRMVGRDDVQGKIAAARIAKKHAGKRIGIMSFPGAYSRTLTKIIMAELADQGITPVSLVQAKASQASFGDEIEELDSKQVEVLYISGGGLDIGIFVRQARQMGAKFSIISSDTLVSKVFQKTAGDAANGIPFTFPPEAVNLDSATPAVETIRAMGNDPAGYTLLAYAATQVWIHGVNKAKSFDANKVAAAIRHEPIQTILGEITFDDKGDIITSYAPFAWFTWKDGKRVSAE